METNDGIHTTFSLLSNLPEGGVQERIGHAFIFTSGTSVFWGVPESERKQLLDTLRSIDIDKNTVKMDDIIYKLDFKHEMEHDFHFQKGEKCGFQQDIISLEDLNSIKHVNCLFFLFWKHESCQT